MATIVVAFGPDAWITLESNPTLSVHATYPQRGHRKETAGEFRGYAGGRVRVITSPRKMSTFPLTLQLLTAADVALLESWQGQLVLLRDGEGLRVWGSFLAGDVVDYWDADGTVSDMAIVFTKLTFDEAVL